MKRNFQLMIKILRCLTDKDTDKEAIGNPGDRFAREQRP